MLKGLFWIFVYLIIILVPLLIVTINSEVTEGFVYELGRNSALAAFMIVMMQVLLAARIRSIERPYGLDILLRFHKYTGIFAAFLLILHPILLAIGAGSADLLISLDQPWYIWLGKITLLLLLIHVGVSWYQRKLKMKFEKWRMTHDVLGPAIIIFIFIHSYVVGTDLQSVSIQTLWIIMVILAVAVFVGHRLIRPYLLKRRPWRVVDLREEMEGVHTVELAPPENGRVYDYLPGQFQFITFYRNRNLPVEEHHWTISSSPTQQGHVTSTIKALGDFTATIKDTRPGDTAAVHAPFGRFSYMLHPKEKDLVFTAGGIGITPLMSMLRHMRDTGDTRSVLLLYGNPDVDRIVFRGELENIEAGKNPNLKVVHVLSDPGDDWKGERGFIDKDKIERYCGEDLSSKTFYVCGPPPLIKGVIAALQQLNVSHRQIRVEIFSFLD
ncbi:MAG: ferredoxin reductase family protein [Desulfobacterales bacterium]